MATKTEIERIAILEEKIDNVCSELAELKGDLKDFINSADQKYASKSVERFMWITIGTLFSAAIGFAIWIMQNYINHLR